MKNDKPIIVSVVEDELEIANSLIKHIDKQEKFCVDNHYLNGEDAIIGIASCKPDIVIMDIGLPGKNGVEVVKETVKRLPEIQIIMFTVFDSDELLFEALSYGAIGYILKDDSYEDILIAINDVLNGGARMSPSIAKKVVERHRQPDKAQLLEKLTDHQMNILRLISECYMNKEIADILEIKEGSVKEQVRRIYKKLQVNNRVEASNLYRNSK